VIDLDTSLLKEDIQIAKYMKKCSLSLIIKEMQNKHTTDYYHTQVRMTIIEEPIKLGS
jgi:hypothetical protein